MAPPLLPTRMPKSFPAAYRNTRNTRGTRRCARPQNALALLTFATTLLATAPENMGRPRQFADILAPPPAQAQGKGRVGVRLEPQTVEAGQAVTYTIEAHTQGHQEIRMVREPQFGPFQVVARSTSPQLFIRNGQAQRSLVIAYTMVALEPGRFPITPPQIAVDSGVMEPETLTVTVTASRSQNPGARGMGIPPGAPQGAPSPFPGDNSDQEEPEEEDPRSAAVPPTAPGVEGARTQDPVFAQLSVHPPRKPYVGEQITVSYDLFVDTRRTQVRPRPPSEPALDQFWVEDLSEQTAGQRQMALYGSRYLERTSLRTLALFSLQPGTARLEAMTVPVVSAGILSSGREATVTSNGATLDVQPLPEGAPASFFEGNVGQWRFDARLDTTDARVGRTLTLELVAEGRGRVSRVQLPALPAVEGLKVVEEAPNARRWVEKFVVHGLKSTRYTLMPTRPGRLEIPALEFSWFDPEQARYQTARSQPIVVQVEDGQLPQSSAQAESRDEKREDGGHEAIARAILAELRPMDLAIGAAPRVADPSLHPWHWLVALLPGLGLIALALGPHVTRLTRRAPSLSRQRRLALEHALMLLTQGEMQPCGERAGACLEALRHYLREGLGQEGAMGTPGELVEALGGAEVPEALQARARALWERCQHLRYAPNANASDAPELVAATQALLRELDAVAKSRPARQATAAALVVLAASLGAMLTATPSPAAADAPATPWASAMAEAQAVSDAGQWPQAAEHWSALAAQAPRDPQVRAMAGVALAHSGALAEARAHLELAARLAPANRHIAHNLHTVRSLVHHDRHMARARSSQKPAAAEGLYWWKAAAGTSPGVLALFMGAGLWLWLAAALWQRLRPGCGGVERRACQVSRWLPATVALCAGLALAFTQGVLASIEVALIAEEDLELREGPSALAAPRTLDVTPGPGLLVEVLERREGWTRIALEAERTGWVSSASLRPVD